MKESQFGFEYTWEDLQPVRTLVLCVLAFQIAGALLGLWIQNYGEWFSNLWAGGAIATLPGYLIGLIAQKTANPGSSAKIECWFAAWT